MDIPPPKYAELFVNVQFVTTGNDDMPRLYIPPPESAELSKNVQFVTVGDDW